MRIAGIKHGSLVDGTGIRTSIFLSGCSHDCEGCHNKEFQAFDYGIDMTINEVLDDIRNDLKFIDGITLTGGDPLFQEKEVIELLELIREDKDFKNLSIWLYTGFLYEEISENIKKYVNVIVDGKYDKNLPKGDWCGSNNQRVIKVR